MKKYIINGGNNLKGEVKISGSKNVALKVLVAACLTEEEVEISNAPLISDLYSMIELIKESGGEVKLEGHTVRIKMGKIKSSRIPFDIGAKVRTSFMLIAPLLLRTGKAIVPNPGGCRIGARPIDRQIEGLEQMGTKIRYDSKDGYFHAVAEKLKGITYRFEKNTHTGTETLIMAASLAQGQTILLNTALEPEIDDLINLLNKMGAKIRREEDRKIIIDGVHKLHGASIKIMPDRNELVTFAIASALTGGEIIIRGGDLNSIASFLEKFNEAGGKWEEVNSGIRFFLLSKEIKPTNITTEPHPGFMTDWQGPWAVLMTQAKGASTIHESIYENRFSYVQELEKMGAQIIPYHPKVKNPKEFYNFNYEDKKNNPMQAIKINGHSQLHNAFIKTADLRAGATLVLAAMVAKGESVIDDIGHLERGYENFDGRLKSLGLNIKVLQD
ncbi:UDP-N-acetylglucosamine 1-carboxyvinyltransferase [Candidatus Parcubacteria bacterium]|nr:MAG: UDP-N-acetylglucosamine 1-carboxyvinyltransferase [Candidatus Parcubacteria bacterium]